MNESPDVHIDKDMTHKSVKEEYELFFNFSIDMLCIAGFDGYFKKLNPSWKKPQISSDSGSFIRPPEYFIHTKEMP